MQNLSIYNNFTGGYNDTALPNNIDDNELLKAVNVELLEKGGIGYRPGTKKLNAEYLGGNVTFLFNWIFKAHERVLFVKDRGLYIMDDEGDVNKLADVASDRLGHFTVQHKLFVGDGVNLYEITENEAEEVEITIARPSSENDTNASYKLTFNSNVKEDGRIWIQAGLGGSFFPEADTSDTIYGLPKRKTIIVMTITSPSDYDPGSFQFGTNPSKPHEGLVFARVNNQTSAEDVANLIETDWNWYKEQEINWQYDAVGFDLDRREGNQLFFVSREEGRHEMRIEKTHDSIDPKPLGVEYEVEVVEPVDIYYKGTLRGIVLDDIMAHTFPGWTKTRSGDSITFTAQEIGFQEIGIDTGTTEIEYTIETIESGASEETIAGFRLFSKCTMFEYHRNSFRIFGAGNKDDPTALYYSEPNEPNNVQETSMLFPVDSEGHITGLTMFQTSLLVSYNHSWFAFKGTDIDQATWTKLSIPHGCTSNDTIALTPNSLTFLSYEGLIAVSTNVVADVYVAMEGDSMVFNLTADKVKGTVKQITNHDRAFGFYYKDRYYLAFTDLPGGDDSDMILVFNWRTQSFVKYTGLLPSYFCRHKDKLLFGTKNNILYFDDEEHNDVHYATGTTKPIYVELETKSYDLGNPVNSKMVDFFNLFMYRGAEEDSKAQITLVADFTTMNSEFALDHVNLEEFLIYGRPWGLRWGYSNVITRRIEVKKAGQFWSFKFNNEEMSRPLVFYGIGFEYRLMSSKIPITNRGGLLE